MEPVRAVSAVLSLLFLDLILEGLNAFLNYDYCRRSPTSNTNDLFRGK